MSDPENYADVPQTITELRSDKSGEAKDWTPRDVLVHMLREIDSGEVDPEAIVVAFSTSPTNVRFYASSPEPRVTFGVLELAKLQAFDAGR